MTAAAVYFGVDEPPPAIAAALGDGDVVLEPFHPLVRDDGYAEAFPRCRRYVYVNPTTVDPWLFERLQEPPPISGRDERWGLPRLDLDRPEALDFAVDQALVAAAADGGRCTGLFVDDLDRLLPDRAGLALRYLARVSTEADRQPRWFVNRGFGLWPDIHALDAVWLEDLTPDVVASTPDDARWLRDEVLPAVEAVRARGVRVHALSYDDQPPVDGPGDMRALQRRLAALVDTITLAADRPLNVWRTSR